MCISDIHQVFINNTVFNKTITLGLHKIKMYAWLCMTTNVQLWMVGDEEKKVWVGFGFKCRLWHSSCIYRRSAQGQKNR